jgi:L-serine deaminase
MAGRAVPNGRMNVKYKETARGGLAVNIIEC